MKRVITDALVRASERTVFHLASRSYDRRSKWADGQLATYAPDVYEFTQARLANGSDNHTFLSWKLLELLWLLDDISPTSIVEFGSGITTFIFARYAAASGASFLTVDQTPAWQEQIRSELPDDLRRCVTWQSCPPCVHLLDGKKSVCYEKAFLENVPTVVDLAYVDGPICHGDTEPCTDVVRMIEAGRTVRHVLFDYRIASAAYLLDCPMGARYGAELNYRLQRSRTGSCLGATDRHHTHAWLRSAVGLSRLAAPPNGERGHST